MDLNSQAYKLVSNTQFYNELTAARLADVSMLVLSYFLSFEPFINGRLNTKRYIVFEVIFMYVYVLVSTYDICFLQLSSTKTFRSGFKLINVIYPTPKSIKLLNITALIREVAFLLSIGILACFIIRYLIGGSIATYFTLVVAMPIAALAGGTLGWWQT